MHSRMLHILLVSIVMVAGFAFWAHPLSSAQAATFKGVFTYHNDYFRTGQNLAETILTPRSIKHPKFGLLFTDAVDGQIYAQPLYAPNVAIPGKGTHNVVFIATQRNQVYAFDADQAGPPLWHRSYIDPANGITPVPAADTHRDNITPWVGITSTPVIDPASGTLYVLTRLKIARGNPVVISYRHHLHALDITTGKERANSPATIAAIVPGSGAWSTNGKIAFDPLRENDRAALALSKGVVYLSFSSIGDFGPYHGWIFGYDAKTLAQVVVFNDTVNGFAGSIWQSGCGPAVDTNGDLIVVTANGTFDTSTPRYDWGDSVLRLAPLNGTLSVKSFFTPYNQADLTYFDFDLGSGGNLLLPDQPGLHPHLMVVIGKDHNIYLVDRDNMGGFHPGGNHIVQEIQGILDEMLGTPAYWQGMVPNKGLQNMIYTIAISERPKMFVIANGKIQTPPVLAPPNTAFGDPGASPSISANGTSDGILWAIDSQNQGGGGPAILYAFEAANLGNELYNSGQSKSDNPGPAVKFAVPTVANGKVYVGTSTQLAVFGLRY